MKVTRLSFLWALCLVGCLDFEPNREKTLSHQPDFPSSDPKGSGGFNPTTGGVAGIGGITSTGGGSSAAGGVGEGGHFPAGGSPAGGGFPAGGSSANGGAPAASGGLDTGGMGGERPEDDTP